MRAAIAILCAGVAAGCMAEGPVPPSEAGAAELAAAVEGRTAGAPRSCVSQLNLGASRSAGNEAIIFEGPGDTIYVNRPAGGCPNLDGRTLVTRTTSTQLCRGDIVAVVDPVSGTEFGSCGLADFVPYTRP